jgi:3-deoxy-D-manno-octulosonic-acid transferase
LVTSGTRTAADLLSRRLPPGAIHQYLPIDAPGPAQRFIGHWRPDIAVFVESELWPNLLLAAQANGTRMALLSAKLSDSSYRNWRSMPLAARTLLGGFELVLAQDGRAANRLESLGVTVAGTADLKFGAAPLPVDTKALQALRAQVGDRPVLLAASTHTGEDQAALRRFAPLKDLADKTGAKPLLVIVPRHPERGAAIAAAATSQAFVTARQSAGQPLNADTEVYVADVMGEIGLWFRLARLAVMGGSLVQGIGGHNPLEPARLGCAIASGPYVDNWSSAYQALDMAEAVVAERAKALVERRDAEARGVIGRVLALLP